MRRMGSHGSKFLAGMLASFLLLFSLSAPIISSHPAFAIPADNETADNDSATDTEDKTTETQNTNDEEESNICIDQTLSLSWIVCSVVSVVASAVDGLYGLIEDLLLVNPATISSDSPIYSIWSYLRDLTNIVFVIIMIITILSQLTGLGISNYGVKKILPKVVIVAIGINLSYFGCMLLVDVSNIAGLSIKNFLDSMMSGISISISFSDALGAFLGGGTLAVGGVVIGALVLGGLSGLFWAFLPLVLGAVLAVVVGLLTIVLRQGVVMLLVMVSPFAIVFYLLPNTSKWFQTWKNLLFQMLFFFPMFAFLFGASKLAGWALIASADSFIWVLVGLAVQVLPLFLSVKLMKMSGTVLGSVSNMLEKGRQRALSPARSYSAEHQQLAKAKYLSQTPRSIPQKIAQSRDRRQFRRTSDLNKIEASRLAKNEAYASNVWDKNGRLTKRGVRLANIESATRESQARTIANTDARDNLTPQEFKAGAVSSALSSAGTKLNASNLALASAVGAGLASAGASREARERSRYNATANRVRSSYDTLSDAEHISTYQKIQKAQDYYDRSYKANVAKMKGQVTERYQAMRTASGSLGKTGISAIIAQAAHKQRAEEEAATGTYEALSQAFETSDDLRKELSLAFDTKNSMMLSAGVKQCVKSKNYKLLAESLSEHTGSINSTNTADLKMQAALANSLLPVDDSILLQGYGKSIWITRAKSEATNEKNAQKRLTGTAVPAGEDMETFYTFDDWAKSSARPRKFKVDAKSSIHASDKTNLFTTEHVTDLEYFKKHNIGDDFTPEQIINGIFSNPSHGETQLKRVDMLLGNGGSWDKNRLILTFDNDAALTLAREKYQPVINNLKTRNFSQFDMRSLDTIAGLFADKGYFTVDDSGKIILDNTNGHDEHILSGLKNILSSLGDRRTNSIKKDIKRRFSRGELDDMDSDTRNLLFKALDISDN